jgi:hypothetical protein
MSESPDAGPDTRRPARPAEAPDPGEPATYAPPAWLRLATNLPLFLGAAILLTQGMAVGAGTMVVAFVAAGLMLGAVLRSFQLQISVSDDVRVVNWRGTRRFPWSDIARFEHDRAGLWLVRRNTERVAVKAFSFGRAIPAVQRQGKAVAEQLEAARRVHRGPVPPRGKKKKKR